MVKKYRPKEKKRFEFRLVIEPREELTTKQVNGLLSEGIEKISRTNYYTKKTEGFLEMFLILDTLEHSSSNVSELGYTITKQERK